MSPPHCQAHGGTLPILFCSHTPIPHCPAPFPINPPSPFSKTSDYLPTQHVRLFGGPICRLTRLSAPDSPESNQEIWEQDGVRPDVVLGLMSFLSWLESVEVGCSTHVSSLEYPLLCLSVKVLDTSTSAILIHRFIVSFLGSPAVQYGGLPNDGANCQVSSSSILSLFVDQQHWAMSVDFISTSLCLC
jgi:hypothetical protein